MSGFEWLTVAITVIGMILIPVVAVLIRFIVKWTQLESKLDEVTRGLKYIVEGSDKTHAALYAQMADDRAATDRRLRWLEEHLWNTRGPSSR
jgi:hypothetical protein